MAVCYGSVLWQYLVAVSCGSMLGTGEQNIFFVNFDNDTSSKLTKATTIIKLIWKN